MFFDRPVQDGAMTHPGPRLSGPHAVCASVVYIISLGERALCMKHWFVQKTAYIGVFLRGVGGSYGYRIKVWMWQEWRFLAWGSGLFSLRCPQILLKLL